MSDSYEPQSDSYITRCHEKGCPWEAWCADIQVASVAYLEHLQDKHSGG